MADVYESSYTTYRPIIGPGQGEKRRILNGPADVRRRALAGKSGMTERRIKLL